jgi:hypothetical protein
MALFWGSSTSTFWQSQSSLFWVASTTWTQTPIGGSTGSFSSGSGTYTVGGSGIGVDGTSDSLYFVSQTATGNIEFTAYVSGQTSSNAYAIAGLMLTDSLNSSNPQCALIGVSPQNGVNFSWRTSDGATAETTLGPSIATPIWLKLVVSQTSVAGYQATDAAGVDWALVGVTTMSLPSSYNVGFAVSSNSSAINTATCSNLSYLTNVVQRSANLISWLRADSNVVYDPSSNDVSLWNDQSANGYNGSQEESANQPTLVANAVNGLPVVQFVPGSDGQFLQFPEGFDFTEGLSLFVVLQPSTMTAGDTILDFRNFSGGASSDQFGLSELSGSGGVVFYAYSGTTSSAANFAGALTAGQFQLLEAVYDGISSVSVYTNGVLQGTQGGLETLNNVSRADNSVGQAGNGANYFDGQIAEILVYSTNLSDADREAVENFLLSKYALS